jgi:hypothetical protein
VPALYIAVSVLFSTRVSRIFEAYRLLECDIVLSGVRLFLVFYTNEEWISSSETLVNVYQAASRSHIIVEVSNPHNHGHEKFICQTQLLTFL